MSSSKATPRRLNLCFYDGQQFPAEYKGDIFAAFHGSWNKARRTGYKIVRVPFDKAGGKARGDYEDFVTGFVTPEGNVWGRPVGITVAKDGSLLFSEDGNNTIWRVSYAGNEACTGHPEPRRREGPPIDYWHANARLTAWMRASRLRWCSSSASRSAAPRTGAFQTALLHQQFVGENAQAIDRRGFHAKNDRPERDRPAPLTPGERKLRGREIAFGTDEHQHVPGPVPMFG